VSLHCQLSDETRGMITADKFKKMKKSAYFINTARGALVDERALADALKNNLIAGAGIDVYSIEPAAKDNPLFFLDNVIVTPHMAGWTRECLARESSGTTMEVIQMLRGKIPDNLVNPEYVKFKK